MKLIPDPTRPPYEVDIEFMIGDADAYQHEVVPMNSLDEVKELASEINRYFAEKSWNQRCRPEPFK